MKKISKKEGMTLIEAVVSIAVFTLVMGAVSWAIYSFYRSNSYTIQQSFAINSGRRGIETMVREIREATYSDTGAYPIISVSPEEFIFYSDVDRDNNIERVRYTLAGSDFIKGTIEASGDPLEYSVDNEITSILSDNIRNNGSVVFSYFDSAGEEVINLSNITDVVLVKVRLVVNVDENRAPEEFTIWSTAQIRNLKINL